MTSNYQIIYLNTDQYSYFHAGTDRASLRTDRTSLETDRYPNKNFIKSQTLVPPIRF